MSEGPRIPRARALMLAQGLIETLRPHCERIEIAGSLRRGKPDVGDIELVCIPKADEMRDLFGGVTLADLESARTASLNARTDIQHAENAMIALRNHRQESDRHYEELMRRAVAGLIADPDFGPDSDAYNAMGYTRRSERKRRTVKSRSGTGGS